MILPLVKLIVFLHIKVSDLRVSKGFLLPNGIFYGVSFVYITQRFDTSIATLVINNGKDIAKQIEEAKIDEKRGYYNL